MDSNSEGSERDNRSQPLFSGEAGRPAEGLAQGEVGSPAREFTLQDPLNTFFSTVRDVTLAPAAFFRGVPRRGGLADAVVFAAICWVVSALLAGIAGLLLNSFLSGSQTFEQALVGAGVAVLVYPVVGVLFVFVAAGILFVLVAVVVRPSGTGFGATLKTISYASTAQLVAWIPFIGVFLWFAWFVVLVIIGTREMHVTSTSRAAVVVLIPVVLFLAIVVLSMALGLVVFLNNQGQI